MDYTIKGNPTGCWRGDKETPEQCVDCYWSHVNDKNQWTDPQECWECECLVADFGGEVAR